MGNGEPHIDVYKLIGYFTFFRYFSSAMIAPDTYTGLIDGEINLERVRMLVPAYLQRNLNAQIYSVLKQKPDMQIYITESQDRGVHAGRRRRGARQTPGLRRRTGLVRVLSK